MNFISIVLGLYSCNLKNYFGDEDKGMEPRNSSHREFIISPGYHSTLFLLFTVKTEGWHDLALV